MCGGGEGVAASRALERHCTGGARVEPDAPRAVVGTQHLELHAPVVIGVDELVGDLAPAAVVTGAAVTAVTAVPGAAQQGAFNDASAPVNSISFGSPHVRYHGTHVWRAHVWCAYRNQVNPPPETCCRSFPKRVALLSPAPAARGAQPVPPPLPPRGSVYTQPSERPDE